MTYHRIYVNIVGYTTMCWGISQAEKYNYRGDKPWSKKKGFQMPHTYIINFWCHSVAALLTVFIPLGKYDTKEITYMQNGVVKKQEPFWIRKASSIFWMKTETK